MPKPVYTPSSFIRRFERMLQSHMDHPWEQVGRCVYCGPCGVRLFQGTMPKDHPIYQRPKKPTQSDHMRERWNK